MRENPRRHARRIRRTSRALSELGVVDQVIEAFTARHWLAPVLAFVLGGVGPAATYVEAHYELNPSIPVYDQYDQTAFYLVLGGLLFSAKTVFAWAQLAFRDDWKAGGFVILLEGVMITSHVPVLPFVLLTILVAINGVATACILSRDCDYPTAALGGGRDDPSPDFGDAHLDDRRRPATPPPSPNRARSRMPRPSHSAQRRFSFVDSTADQSLATTRQP